MRLTGKQHKVIGTYLRCADELKFSGSVVPVTECDDSGVDADEAFTRFDARGQAVGCDDPNRLAKLHHGKACLNLHIEMWSAGLKDVPLRELRANYPWLPLWVWKAVVAQAGDTWALEYVKESEDAG